MRKAFSLVELSIVLVIIGLLVAGATSAKKMIKSSKMNKFVEELAVIETNLNTFRGVYGQYPGDFDEAVIFWGSGDSNVSGNGNNKIEWSAEARAVWYHLMKADLVEDKGYAGNTLLNPSDIYDDGAFWILHSTNANTGNKHGGYNYIENGLHLIQFGAGSSGNDAVFLPIDSYLIDLKIDDGKPKSGRVSYREISDSTNANCTNSSYSYYTTSSTIGCNLIKTF